MLNHGKLIVTIVAGTLALISSFATAPAAFGLAGEPAPAAAKGDGGASALTSKDGGAAPLAAQTFAGDHDH